ncbi:hypothetical protein KIH27_14250 [Mycobacterium sp. M1]|uniref:Secreted protein n=1 Tax=Mycolicibacter acidiphilus TaxID=2835306 RepID=A0ABS5RKD0_9MYCO|nr:hypothetical protein [Mycolicibacter acidiphilus]MBS9534751.1 hypothetical protein [Mycolicibacter acidiphilus]
MVAKMLAAVVGVVGVTLAGNWIAHADVPPFPDLNSYMAVNVQDYEIDTSTPGIVAKQVFFLTPAGIECDLNASSAGCSGNNFPKVPPQVWNPAAGITGVNTISTDYGLSATNAAYPFGHKVHGRLVKTLPPLHFIAVDGVVCGADDKQMVACKDAQGRGFILSPSWSGWLPHV